MAFRAICVAEDPLDYFLEQRSGEVRLRVSDVLLRYNHSHKDIFADFIRIGTQSKWSHTGLIYLLSDLQMGFKNTFIVEARTKGIHLQSWRNEIYPLKQFTVGLKRLDLSWYIETPYEKARHDSNDPEDTHGVGYLRHVRGIAVDQINGLFDHKTVFELAALYIERAAKRHLPDVLQVANIAEAVADIFKKWDESDEKATNVMHFVCSGLVQYSFFAALRFRILKDLAIPEHRDAAMSNLRNMQRIIFREDPEGIMANYMQQIQAGTLRLDDSIPGDVEDLLKTATPADFNNCANLEWQYVIREGVVWRIEKTEDDYVPEDEDEAAVLELLSQEHTS